MTNILSCNLYVYESCILTWCIKQSILQYMYYTRHSLYSAYCNVQSEKCNVVFNKMYHAECILHLGFFIRHEMWYILLIAVFILHVAKCKSHNILCHVNTSSFYYYYAICTICKIQHAASNMQYYYIAYIIWNFE